MAAKDIAPSFGIISGKDTGGSPAPLRQQVDKFPAGIHIQICLKIHRIFGPFRNCGGLFLNSGEIQAHEAAFQLVGLLLQPFHCSGRQTSPAHRREPWRFLSPGNPYAHTTDPDNLSRLYPPSRR